MTEPMTEPGTAPVVPSSDADGTTGPVTVRALPARRRRKPSRRELLAALSLVAIAAVAASALVVTGWLYAGVWTGVAVGGACAVLVAGALCAAALRQQAAPWFMVDADGVWLVRRRGRRQGLPWDGVAAVAVVGSEAAGGDGPLPKPPQVVRAGLARKPFVDLYPAGRATADLVSPLGCRVVTAQPAVAGLRGRRYIVELAVPAEDAAALDRAVHRFAPDRRLTP